MTLGTGICVLGSTGGTTWNTGVSTGGRGLMGAVTGKYWGWTWGCWGALDAAMGLMGEQGAASWGGTGSIVVGLGGGRNWGAGGHWGQELGYWG